MTDIVNMNYGELIDLHDAIRYILDTNKPYDFEAIDTAALEQLYKQTEDRITELEAQELECELCSFEQWA